MATSNKTISLSYEEQIYVTELAKTQMMSFSAAAGAIIRAHRKMRPDIVKQEALKNLRAAAIVLWTDVGIPQEAVISWVREATGGE